MVTLYNVISEDGYIAERGGTENFIPDSVWSDFLNLCQQNDVVIMGRKTYEAIQQYPATLIKEFENLKLKKVVVTRNSNYKIKASYIITNGLKVALVLGNNVLISSGPDLNTGAVAEEIIDKVILNIIPSKVLDGIKQFNVEPELKMIFEKKFEDGRIWREYQVVK